MKTLTILCGSLFLLTATTGQGYKPKSGFIPDSTTATKIAEAVLTPVYGERILWPSGHSAPDSMETCGPLPEPCTAQMDKEIRLRATIATGVLQLYGFHGLMEEFCL